jgi:hypothetical protein
MSLKVLLVSIAFPPKRDPESLQVAKYCNFLKNDQRVTLEVVTSSDPTLFMEPDTSLNHYREGIHVPVALKVSENKYVNFLLRKINPTWLQLPDSKFSFWWQSRKVLNAIKQKPDVLYSRSYPISSTILALKLKQEWNIPWVLHLSDPWAQSSLSYLSPATSFSSEARVWNKTKEELCFEYADKISLTSHKTIALYAKAYPHLAHKFVYFPNVFDDDLIRDNPYAPKPILKFVYNGGFGEARTPEPFLRAIDLFWKKHGMGLESKIEFLFTGEMTRANTAIFSRYEYIPWIKHLGVISYDDVLKMQRDADVLINIDSNIPDPDHAVFFPSKLLDYMVAQRRVMAITNLHSTTHDVVQGKLGDCFEFDEIERMSAYLYEVYLKYQEKNVQYFYKSDMGQEFSARSNAKRLTDLFLKLKAK